MALNGLEFVESGLTLSYQGSLEPQELDIRLFTQQATDRAAVLISLRMLEDIINDGGAGGTEFHPSTGTVAPINFRFEDDYESYGPEYHHVLRVTGVSHRFMRTVVEQLRQPRLGVNRMTVVGSLPVTEPAYSVTDADIRAVLDDPTAYVGRWPTPGFDLEVSDSERGATVVVEFAQTLSAETFTAVEVILIGFPGNISTYLSDAGTIVDTADLSRRLPRIGKKKRSVTAFYEHLGHAREPSIAMLSNMLCRFNEKVAPIARVKVAY